MTDLAQVELGSLYDMNKQLMKNEPILDLIIYSKKADEVVKHFNKSTYCMLLCNERRDYTIFNLNKYNWRGSEAFKDEIILTLNNRGNILSIDLQEDGAYEIWIKDFATEECFVYYLFDYSQGVIEVGESLKNE